MGDVGQLQNVLGGDGVSPGLQSLLGLPDINQGEDMMKEKCLKNGGNGSFDAYMVRNILVLLIYFPSIYVNVVIIQFVLIIQEDIIKIL